MESGSPRLLPRKSEKVTKQQTAFDIKNFKGITETQQPKTSWKEVQR